VSVEQINDLNFVYFLRVSEREREGERERGRERERKSEK
jgi:hypothetical protein